MTTDIPTKPSFMGIIQKILALIGVIVLSLALIIFATIGPLPGNNTSASYSDINEHFKYGSIGGESTNGLPYWIWKVLPTMFPDKMPESGQDYTAFGFMQEPDQELPIGFAKSKVNGLEVITQNCATCHVGTVRSSKTSEAQIITTMPSHNVNLGAYIQFLSSVGTDARFNAREMMPYIAAAGANLNPIQKLLYQFVAIPQAKDALGIQAKKFAFMDRQTPYGPGRVDTFTPYKALRFNFPTDGLKESEINGIADFPPVWAQRPREGLQLHWDGNNDSVDERNKSASLALVQPTSINFPSVLRVKEWLRDVPPPKYPFPIDQALAAKGKVLYDNNCASCHAFDGKQVGTVEPIDKIGTDSGRLDSYTYELASNQYTLFTGVTYQGEDQRFTHFRKTNGYANLPLDGMWLRAPYLHNGSVPTLWDLLEKPENRPKVFYRGYDVFDSQKVGFVSDVAEENGQAYFKYDTSLPGNGNQGHVYGTYSDEEKAALVEYMKGI
ncbi:MAG: c-type cytochrome [Microcystaceae cyanobacterium]